MRADLTDGRAPRSIALAQVRGEPALLGQESRHAQHYGARPDIAQVPVSEGSLMVLRPRATP